MDLTPGGLSGRVSWQVGPGAPSCSASVAWEGGQEQPCTERPLLSWGSHVTFHSYSKRSVFLHPYKWVHFVTTKRAPRLMLR